MAYDILIKSGTVIDGSGGELGVADVGIKDDKIAEVGALGESRAKIVINALGKYVTPGFVDITNHSDTHLTLFQHPRLESLLMQGITTIIGGNCGASLAPLGSRFAIGAIRKWADPSLMNINWAGMAEFLSVVENFQPAVNFGTLAGYGTLRRSVIGEEARPLAPEEFSKIKFLLGEALREGAFGLSLGLSYGHERVSTTEEIIEVARTVVQYGRIIKIHLRSEGKEFLASVNEAIRIGREAGVPVQISHLKAIGRKAWPSLPKTLELIQHARSSGVDINFDVSPYSTTGSPLYLLLPSWSREGGFSKLLERLKNERERSRIEVELKEYTFHYDRIFIIGAKSSSIVGHTMAEVAEHMSVSPERAMLDILSVNEGRVTIVGRTVSARNTGAALADPNALVASDGFGTSQEASQSGNLVHPRCFGAFPHFWHRFVQDKSILKPEEAVRKMTSAPAVKLGISQRGLIAKNYFADLVVFDPKIFHDRATHRNPYRYPAGIEWVLVNGRVAVEQGRPVGVRVGRVLRRQTA